MNLPQNPFPCFEHTPLHILSLCKAVMDPLRCIFMKCDKKYSERSWQVPAKGKTTWENVQ